MTMYFVTPSRNGAKYCLITFLGLILLSPVSPASKCQYFLDLIFVVDSSLSVCPTFGENNTICEEWDSIIGFTKDISSAFEISEYGTLAAGVIYSKKVTVLWNINYLLLEKYLMGALSFMKFEGGPTYTGLAYKTVREKVVNSQDDRRDARNVLILITSGPPEDPDVASLYAGKLVATGTELMVVATRNISEKILADLSSPPYMKNRNYFMVNSPDELGSIKDEIIKHIGCKENRMRTLLMKNLGYIVLASIIALLCLLRVFLYLSSKAQKEKEQKNLELSIG